MDNRRVCFRRKPHHLKELCIRIGIEYITKLMKQPHIYRLIGLSYSMTMTTTTNFRLECNYHHETRIIKYTSGTCRLRTSFQLSLIYVCTFTQGILYDRKGSHFTCTQPFLPRGFFLMTFQEIFTRFT